VGENHYRIVEVTDNITAHKIYKIYKVYQNLSNLSGRTTAIAGFGTLQVTILIPEKNR